MNIASCQLLNFPYYDLRLSTQDFRLKKRACPPKESFGPVGRNRAGCGACPEERGAHTAQALATMAGPKDSYGVSATPRHAKHTGTKL